METHTKQLYSSVKSDKKLFFQSLQKALHVPQPKYSPAPPKVAYGVITSLNFLRILFKHASLDMSNF